MTIIFVLAGFAAGAGVVGLYYQMQHLNERIKKLEESNNKRINYYSLAELEHLMAGVVLLEDHIGFESQVLENIRAHAERARNPLIDKNK